MSDNDAVIRAPGALGRLLTRLHRRQRYISHPAAQYALMRQFAGVLLAGVALALANAYVIHLLTPGGLRRVVPILFTESGIVSYVLVLCTVSFGIVLALSIVYSHRVGGPAAKLAEALMRMSTGDLEVRTHLREDDLLHDLADAVNGLADCLERSLVDLERALARLRACPALDAEAKRALHDAEAVLHRYGRAIPAHRGE